MNFQISDIRITPVKPVDGLVAFASLVINGNLHLGSIAIHRKLDGSGYRLTYPTKKVGMADRTVYHPLTPELSRAIEQALFDDDAKLIAWMLVDIKI